MQTSDHTESNRPFSESKARSAWDSVNEALEETEPAGFGPRFYLNYGLDHLHPDLDLDSVLNFLNRSLQEDNTLTSARTKKSLYRDSELECTRICSFCGMPLTEANYERLADGSIRCEACSQEQIETVGELQAIYEQMRREFETLFHVRLPEGIRLVMSPALSQGSGRILPAPIVRPDDQTPIGAAVCGAEGYTIWLRDGLSRLSGMLALACLFTLIWQEQHWDLDHLEALCRQSGQEGLYEGISLGMSEWAGMQMMLVRGEDSFSRQNRQRILSGPIPRRVGFQLMEKTYPFARHGQPADHPFHERVPVDLHRLSAMLQSS